MTAVLSFWSKPFLNGCVIAWASEKHHLLAWILSLETARRHYPRTCLYTDDAGAEMLVDGLGLEFGEVTTALNALADADPTWWVLGKVYAYGLSQEPFVHLDTDVFLWKRLPERLEAADVFAQNPEPFLSGAGYYRPEAVEQALGATGGAWLPEEWIWYRASGRQQRGDCCGIFGGRQMDFIHHYSRQACRLIEDSANQQALCGLANIPVHNVLFEQYMLSACVEAWSRPSHKARSPVEMRYLFSSMGDAFNPQRAVEAGFTHLLADAKKNPVLMDHLERRVRRDCPLQYERCLAYLARRPRGFSVAGR